MSRTVLYVHGLESGPRGKKALTLEAAGFRVVSAQMPCNRAAVLKDPVVVSLFVAALAVLALGVWQRGSSGFVIAVVFLFVIQRFVRPAVMRRIFRRSVAVQLELLAREPVDVVVGSSFGGAVALELINRGAWKGQTLLLCPAHRLVAARGWTPSPTLPADARQVTVVHGRQDETVPLEHSRSLVRGTAATLIEVDDDHRLTNTATAENFAAWIQPH
jgi:pimeloyl-ACP methyl ester carboxylesterase